MTKSLKLAAALLIAGLALIVPLAGGSAQAAPASGPEDTATADKVGVRTTYETYKNEATRECLDDLDGDLWTYDCDRDFTEQDWIVKHWADSTVRFQNRRTRDCLDDSGGTLGTSSCNKSEEQSFYVKHWADGTMRFKNEATGQCVKGAPGHEVGSSKNCDSSEAQSWY